MIAAAGDWLRRRPVSAARSSQNPAAVGLLAAYAEEVAAICGEPQRAPSGAREGVFDDMDEDFDDEDFENDDLEDDDDDDFEDDDLDEDADFDDDDFDGYDSEDEDDDTEEYYSGFDPC